MTEDIRDKGKNDPPGLRLVWEADDRHFAPDGSGEWHVEIASTMGPVRAMFFRAFADRAIGEADIRAAAWAWHDRRLALATRLKGEGVQLDMWPASLVWTDDECRECEVWPGMRALPDDFPAVLRRLADADSQHGDACDSVFVPVKRFDYNKPPPGYQTSGRFWGFTGGGDVELRSGRDDAPSRSCLGRAALGVAAAWTDYKFHNDPPHLHPNDSSERMAAAFLCSVAEWRAAAWAWHDRRHALAARLTLQDAWPRCPRWTDAECDQVNRWASRKSAAAEPAEDPEVGALIEHQRDLRQHEMGIADQLRATREERDALQLEVERLGQAKAAAPDESRRAPAVIPHPKVETYFAICMFQDADEYPPWVPAKSIEKARVSDYGTFLAIKCGDDISVFSDGGPPEDASFFRDFYWVPEVVQQAFNAGLVCGPARCADNGTPGCGETEGHGPSGCDTSDPLADLAAASGLPLAFHPKHTAKSAAPETSRCGDLADGNTPEVESALVAEVLG